MSDSFPIFDIIILCGGIYLLYSAFGMYTENRIPGVLLSKGMEIGKEADVTGFIQAMKIPTVIMGLVAFSSGAVGIACKYVTGLEMIQLGLVILSFFMLVGYGYLDVRAQKKYLNIK
ncbi:MAG: hypothetical protein PHE02_08800 [Lachnospiraceae bacterium]|nr:hypothetical protein [Lachnospiraceae bacterium]